MTAFTDLPALGELGDRLASAFAQAEQAKRPRRVAWAPARYRPLLIGTLLFLLLAASAAAATLLVLRGSVIPAPEKVDLQPPMIVKPDTARLSGVTAIDPVDRRKWTVRLARSQTGLVCLTAGELRGGQFGITGLDRRFRRLAPGFTDGCGTPYVGARVFDARERRDVRTVVDGYAGPKLRRVVLESSAGTRDVPVSKEGAFVGVFAGYPEDIGIRAKLVFADGHAETHTFGSSAFIAADPDGATKTESYQVSNAMNTNCVRVRSAREVPPFSITPPACGDRRGWFFFRALRLRNGTRGGRGFNSWRWQHASRTVVYGWIHERLVKSATLVGPGRAVRIRPSVNGSFQRLYASGVDPHRIVLVVTRRDGTVERARMQAHLVPPPGSNR